MPREQLFNMVNPQDQTVTQTAKQYYPRTIYSTWAMATGDTGFTPFANVEADTLRNYNRGQNIFAQNQGRVLYLWGDITGPAGVGFIPVTGVATATVLDAYKAWWNQLRLEVAQDSQVTQEALLCELFPAPPMYTIATTSGAPTIGWENNVGGGEMATSSRRGIYFRPPIFVGNGRSINFRVSSPSNYTVPAALNTFRAIFYMRIEELVPNNPQPVRT